MFKEIKNVNDYCELLKNMQDRKQNKEFLEFYQSKNFEIEQVKKEHYNLTINLTKNDSETIDKIANDLFKISRSKLVINALKFHYSGNQVTVSKNYFVNNDKKEKLRIYRIPVYLNDLLRTECKIRGLTYNDILMYAIYSYVNNNGVDLNFL